MCRVQEPLFLGVLNLEDGGCQLLRKVDNYLPCVWSHIPENLLLIRISVRTLNFLMQSFLFYMVLVHETIDFRTMDITVCTTILTEKNSCRKYLKTWIAY